MPDVILTARQVVTPARILAPGWLLLDGDRIAEVGEGAPPRAADLDLGDATVVPGFVDLHVHGGGGATFDTGTADAADVVAATHLAHGTTSMAASLVTDTRERMVAAIGELALLVQDGRLAGIHLEGPWLSPQRSGAHQPGSLTHPDPAVGRRPPRRRRRRGADGHPRTRAARRHRRRTAASSTPACSPRSATPTRRTTRRARHSTPAPGSAPTSSTRCARCTTATPDPSARCSTPPSTSSSSPTACTCTPRCCARCSPPSRAAASSSPTRWRGPARPTATTPSARWRSRCATASPGWPTDRAPARSRARPSRWTRRSASP